MSEREILRPTFGQVLRGARLGYAWHGGHQCFIRISAEGPPYKIDIAPEPPSTPVKDHYCVWWESTDGNLIDLLDAEIFASPVSKHLTMYVNNNGELL